MAAPTMKAAVYKKADNGITIQEIPIPEPQGRQVLVRVKAASLCHSDLLFIEGGVEGPLILGHEAVSVVEKLGPDASTFGVGVGDLIGTPCWEDACFQCFGCKTAGEQFCSSLKMKGISSPGLFQEYTLVDAAEAVMLAKAGTDPPVPAAQLAPLFCAGITVWDALERASLKASDTVAIIGVGGLGQIATRYAHAMGVKVLALDVKDEQLQAVQDVGLAHGVLNTSGLSKEDLVNKVLALNDGKTVDVVLITSGVTPAYLNGLAITRPGGKLLAIGVMHEPIPVSIPLIVNRCISIIGAKVPGKSGAQRCFDFTVRNKLFPKINNRSFKLEDLNEMIDLMRAGEIHHGRMVVQFF